MTAKSLIQFKTLGGYESNIEWDTDATPEDLEKLLKGNQWIDGKLGENGLFPRHPAATSGKTQAAPKSEPAPAQEKSLEGTLVDNVVKELDASVVPTEPGDRGLEHITKVEIAPQQGEKVNILFYGFWNDQPAKYANLKIYGWGYEAVGKLFGWGVEHFKEPKTFEGNWNVEYEISSNKNTKGNYYKNVVSVSEREL